MKLLYGALLLLLLGGCITAEPQTTTSTAVDTDPISQDVSQMEELYVEALMDDASDIEPDDPLMSEEADEMYEQDENSLEIQQTRGPTGYRALGVPRLRAMANRVRARVCSNPRVARRWRRFCGSRGLGGIGPRMRRVMRRARRRWCASRAGSLSPLMQRFCVGRAQLTRMVIGRGRRRFDEDEDGSETSAESETSTETESDENEATDHDIPPMYCYVIRGRLRCIPAWGWGRGGEGGEGGRGGGEGGEGGAGGEGGEGGGAGGEGGAGGRLL